MLKRLRALKLFTFVVVALTAVLLADLGQALGESFLVPQEDRMHALVNETRAGHGRPPLDKDDALRWMARRQAQAMAAAGYIYHTADLASAADASALPWLSLGENVGKGPSVDDVHRAFLSSPTHFQNVIHQDFNTLGVGAIADAASAMYFTQSYAALQAAPPPPPPPPPAPAPQPAPAPAAPPPPTDPPPAPDPTPTTEVAGNDATRPEATPDEQAEADQTAEPDPPPRPRSAEPAAEPERPSLWQLIIAMFGRFASRVVFWG